MKPTPPLLAALLLCGCITSGQSLPVAEQRAASLLGAWDTAAQFHAAPEPLKRPPSAGNAAPWLDRQHGTFARATVPALTPQGGQAIYLTWRAGGPTGPISRQRLWVFRPSDNGLVMDFYTFKDPGKLEPNPDFTSLTAADVIGYGEACALPVVATRQGWRASIPQSCTITARSGRKMTLSATIEVSQSRLTYQEAGILEGGGIAFKVPGTARYEFDRLKD
jgi:CpeT/CpcT family (DUF1001)